MRLLLFKETSLVMARYLCCRDEMSPQALAEHSNVSELLSGRILVVVE